MKIDGNQLKIGNVITHKGRLWRVLRTQHVKPGKGGAFLQAELRDIRNGAKLNERFRSAETIERVRLEQRPCQFLYSEGSMRVFMDSENYEQYSIPVSQIGDEAERFLTNGLELHVEMIESLPVSIVLPETVILEVTSAEPVVKGQTQSSSFKPAMLENGIRIMVPPYISAGTRIVVSTENTSFVERAK